MTENLGRRDFMKAASATVAALAGCYTGQEGGPKNLAGAPMENLNDIPSDVWERFRTAPTISDLEEPDETPAFALTGNGRARYDEDAGWVLMEGGSAENPVPGTQHFEAAQIGDSDTITGLQNSNLHLNPDGSLSAAAPGPGATQATDLDVFMVSGQSNAEGRGDSTLSPDVDAQGAAFYYSGNASDNLQHLDDPVGDASSGSAWPAFARYYYRLTGRKPVIVEYAAGGSAQHKDADAGSGHWDDGGNLRSGAETRIDNTMTRLQNLGWTPTFRGVLWSQGERDAQAIDNGTISATQYRNALKEMVELFNQNLSYDVTLYVFQTGKPDSGDTAGFQAVREEQRDAADSRSDIVLVFDDAETFPDRGFMTDDLHYNQDGYNEMGKYGAGTLASLVERPGNAVARRADHTAHDNLKGVNGELTAVTDTNAVRLHDGSTRGGFTVGEEHNLQAYLSANQTVSSGTANAETVVFDSVTEDETGNYDSTTGVYTVPEDGKYEISATVMWNSAIPSGTPVRLDIQVNGGQAKGIAEWSVTPASDFYSMDVHRKGTDLLSGDSVEIVAAQESGGTVDLYGSQSFTSFEVAKIKD